MASVNKLIIPAGSPVHFSLTSATVMQSFFIPQPAGQIYAMAGMTTQLNLAADAPGTYRGENTQFTGMGFQNQKFPVVRDGRRLSGVARPNAGERQDPRHGHLQDPVGALGPSPAEPVRLDRPEPVLVDRRNE